MRLNAATNGALRILMACRNDRPLGETMRCDGAFNGRQIVPAAVVADIRRGADRTHFRAAGYSTLPGFSCRNMWWATHDAHRAFLARGIHGQSL